MRHHADGAAGVEHIGGRAALIGGLDLHGGVGLAGGGAADQERNRQAPPLHLTSDKDHFVEGGRDQARQPNGVSLVFDGRVNNPIRRAHDAQIDNLVIVALQDNANNILTDIVHVALDGGHDDAACGLISLATTFGLHERHQVGDSLFHHPRRLDHLR